VFTSSTFCKYLEINIPSFVFRSIDAQVPGIGYNSSDSEHVIYSFLDSTRFWVSTLDIQQMTAFAVNQSSSYHIYGAWDSKLSFLLYFSLYIIVLAIYIGL
jgi:hypothetical protein